MTQSDPTVRSQELGDELRALREANTLSLVDAARRIDASGSKLSRIETGISAPSAEDVSGLLVLYGVTGEKRRSSSLWQGVRTPRLVAAQPPGLRGTATNTRVAGGESRQHRQLRGDRGAGTAPDR
ncbi:helix-turn-helix domain-containing protein [Saccharopolyspora spinosporotrichia]